MAEELTENEQRALDTYSKGGGWYEYPGVEKSLRKNELLELLDGDEFVVEDEDPDATQDGPVVDEDGEPIVRAGTPGYEIAENIRRNIRDEPERVDPPKVEPLEQPTRPGTTVDLSDRSTSSVQMPDLSVGDKNHVVRGLKAVLSINGYPTDTSPLYDPRLELAVSEFQQSVRLPATGEVDGRTWEKLFDTERPV